MRSEAIRCCDPKKNYICDACETEHDDEGAAETCCDPSGKINPAALERYGQGRLIP